jgi:hypothetical protein
MEIDLPNKTVFIRSALHDKEFFENFGVVVEYHLLLVILDQHMVGILGTVLLRDNIDVHFGAGWLWLL